jgi:exodeoxyribonuclease VII small subunit
MVKTAAKEAPVAVSFETALGELEKLVAGMEGGQLSLEASLASYRRGAELLGYCQGQLQAVQSQVKVLEDGMLKDFNLDAGGSRARSVGDDDAADDEEDAD